LAGAGRCPPAACSNSSSPSRIGVRCRDRRDDLVAEDWIGDDAEDWRRPAAKNDF
jgi:hypothetical protein